MTISKKLLVPVILFCVAAFFSCKKSSDSSQTNTISARPAYQKKWNISSATTLHRPAGVGKGSFLRPAANSFSRRPTGDTSYAAIEFLINSYVIFYTDNSVKVGQYTATNDTTLVLDSLGTIHITSITSATFSFTLAPLGGIPSITITATPAVALGSFSNLSDSLFISSTWKIDSIYDVTLGTTDHSLYSDDSLSAVYAVFSQYGTYLVRDVYTNGQEDYQTNTWQWSNSAHNQFCYGNWDGQNAPDCTGLQTVAVSFSAPYNQLILQESSDSTGADAFRYYLSKQ